MEKNNTKEIILTQKATLNYIYDWLIEEYGAKKVTREGGIHVTVNYPEIIIKNENNQSHIIYDLDVIFLFSDSNLKMNGRRNSYTHREKNLSVGYSHSHLGHHEEGAFGKFCKGPIYEVNFIDFNNHKTVHRLELILNYLDTYIHSESVSGGPYVRMERMYPGGKSSNLSKKEKKKIVSSSQIGFGISSYLPVIINCDRSLIEDIKILDSAVIKDRNLPYTEIDIAEVERRNPTIKFVPEKLGKIVKNQKIQITDAFITSTKNELNRIVQGNFYTILNTINHNSRQPL